MAARILTADSNSLRKDYLRAFLRESSDNAVAIDHLVLFEMFKKNPVNTAKESLRIASDHLSQLYVIKPTHEWLDNVVSNEIEAEKLIDDVATMRLRDICANLFTEPTPTWVSQELQKVQVKSLDYIQRLRTQLEGIDQAMLDFARSFSKEEIKTIKASEAVPDNVRQKMTELWHNVFARFYLENQEPGRTDPISTQAALNMFGFRYALCICLYYLDTIQRGSWSKTLDKRVNDAIDLQISAVSTFFNGMASNDNLTAVISREATAILARKGAYIRFVD